MPYALNLSKMIFGIIIPNSSSWLWGGWLGVKMVYHSAVDTNLCGCLPLKGRDQTLYKKPPNRESKWSFYSFHNAFLDKFKEKVGWHHWLNGYEFEQTLGDSEGHGSPVCCSPWGHKELDTTKWLNSNSKALFNRRSSEKRGAFSSVHPVKERNSPAILNGNPLQCSCLENPKDGGAWWAARSMGLHRVGHDGSDLAAAAAYSSEQ